MTKPKFFLSHPRRPEKLIKENLEDADSIAKNELKGLNLVEPFKEIPQDGSVSEEQAMAECINLLMDCDGIIMTGDWEKSTGCFLEYRIAKATGKTILELLR